VKLLNDPERLKKKESEFHDRCHILKPLIEQSFDHHDKDKNGILDTDESMDFFQDFVDLQEPMINAIAEVTLRLMLEIQIGVTAEQVKHMAGKQAAVEAIDEMRHEIEKQIDRANKTSRMVLRESKQEYLDHKDLKNKEAFDSIDVNKDGKLQKEEVVQALLPGTDQNKAFMKSLGYDTERMGKRSHEIACREHGFIPSNLSSSETLGEVVHDVGEAPDLPIVGL